MIVFSPTLPGNGRITGVFVSPDSHILAVASLFPLLTNPPGRAAYTGQRLRHRLALYHRGERRPFAAFDMLRLPINDISFHPHEPVIAIAAGSYDGGWFFEGELVAWNWSSDRSWPLAGGLPEIERCSFNVAGDRLDLLVRPWDEEWGSEESEEDPFDRLYPVNVAYEGAVGSIAVEIDPATWIARQMIDRQMSDQDRQSAMERQLAIWFGTDRLVQRGAIWDVAWLDSGRLAAVHDLCLLEIYDLENGSVVCFSGEGYGARILRSSPPIVQIGPPASALGEAPRSRLQVLRDGHLAEFGAFEGVYTFVSSRDGRVLGRRDRHPAGFGQADVLIDIGTGQARFVDLGHYDCFNHHIGIDGAPDLYLLQGTPPTSHKKKRLCRVRPDGTVEDLWPLLPADGSHASHAMECIGCYVEDDAGRGIVVAGRHYHPDPRQGHHGFIYRKAIERPGREIWRHATAAAASAVVHVRPIGLVVAALLDGTILVLDAAAGTVVAKARAAVNGVATVIYSMDTSDASLAVGTFEGCIAVIALDDLSADGGILELA